MILLLILMTPGIPEFLTGSSQVSTLFISPLTFFLILLVNIGMYSGGALLIREFMIRANKGWMSVLFLGFAYGIMEEGVAVHTFFLASGNPVGSLGTYGRYAGMDWIWALGITSFHGVYSITLPLFLLRLAYPEYAKESMLRFGRAKGVLLIYLLDIVFANYLAVGFEGFAPSGTYYLFLILVSAFLAAIAYTIPGDFALHRSRGEISGKRMPFLAGLLVFPIYIFYSVIVPYIFPGSPLADVLFLLFLYLILFRSFVVHIPGVDRDRYLLWFCTGLLVSLLFFALIEQVSLANPLAFIPILAAICLMRRLFRIVASRNEQISGTAS